MQSNKLYKESTLQLRLSKQQKESISQASKLRHMSLSHFVLEKAYTAAQEILGEQNHFALSDEQWGQFCRALDAPAHQIPTLRHLLKEDTVLDDN